MDSEPQDRSASAIDPDECLEAIFVLRYDEELSYLVNEGVVRPGMMPSGFKD